jgi:predicted RNA-binding Zn-ribbon protein involved in translation (DUF1610 family)
MEQTRVEQLSRGEQYHKHQCWNCRAVWEHSEVCASVDSDTFESAHTCPNCYTPEIYRKYFGANDPDVQSPVNCIEAKNENLRAMLKVIDMLRLWE